MCHKFQGTALQHVRAGRCRFRGEKGEEPGAGLAPSPGSRAPPGCAYSAYRHRETGISEHRNFPLVLFGSSAGDKKSASILREEKRQKPNRSNRKPPKQIFSEGIRAVAVRARITGPRAHKSACLRVSCPPSFPARTRFSCLSAVFPQRFLFNTSGGSGRFGGSRSLFSISQYGHCLPAHARRAA